MKLSVVIPVYNEIYTLEEIIKRVKAVNIPKEMIIVDDGSTDGSREYLINLAQRYKFDGLNEIKVFFHQKNLGKGAALSTGFKNITGDIVIVQDADLEYNPQEYQKLIAPIIEGKADVVYGTRFLGFPRRILFFRHTLGNKLLTFLSNLFTDLNLSDMETGYKVFKKEVIKNINITSKRFGVEPEITAKIAKMRCRIYEVPISYAGRDYLAGKKITWKDGIEALWTIIKYALFYKGEPQDHALISLRKATHYNYWIYEQIKPFLGKRILEIGSGIGNIGRFFLNKELILLTDIEERYLLHLEETFSVYGKVKVKKWDCLKDDISELKEFDIDTVVCLNVLEHLKEDKIVLKKFYQLLPSGGRVVILVPALKFLYGSFDKYFGHYRRYEKEELIALLEDTQFKIEKISYFNFIGALSWFLNAKLLRQAHFSPQQLELFNLFVPLIKRIEKKFSPPFGISLIAIGEKR
jgi:glycosyltransferase involved in cell wall biosynthesis